MPLNNQTTAAVVKYGSYNGNSSANKAVAHSLGKTPHAVIIASRDGTTATTARGMFMISAASGKVVMPINQADGSLSVSAMDSTNFYVGNATSHAQSANFTGYTYYWVAIG